MLSLLIKHWEKSSQGDNSFIVFWSDIDKREYDNIGNSHYAVS